MFFRAYLNRGEGEYLIDMHTHSNMHHPRRPLFERTPQKKPTPR